MTKRVVGGSAFEEACDAVRRLLRDVVCDEVRTRHRIGLILRHVQSEASTYGEGAVERMAELIGVSSHILYQCARVSGDWSVDELADQNARTNRRGEPLSWSHLVALTRSPTEAARRDWVKRCLAESWSVRDLRQAMVTERAGKSDDRDEEGTAEPAGIALREGLQQASRAAAQFEVIHEALQARLAGEASDEALRARVIQAYERLGRKLERTLDYLRRPTDVSEKRLRVAVRSSTPEEPRGDEEDASRGRSRSAR